MNFVWMKFCFKILCTDIRLVSCCWATLQMDNLWSSTKDCATSNIYSSTVADSGLPRIVWFFTLSISSKCFIVQQPIF